MINTNINYVELEFPSLIFFNTANIMNHDNKSSGGYWLHQNEMMDVSLSDAAVVISFEYSGE